MSEALRRTIPITITFVVGMILFADYFLKIPFVGDATQILMNFVIVIAGFALGLGAGNIVLIHGQHIRKRTPRQWYFSAWLLIVMIVFVVIGIGFTLNAPAYVWLFNNTLTAISTTTYSLLAFSIASAAYRAFRFRTKEGAVMLIAGIIVMLGNVPAVISVFPSLFDANSWIMNVPTLAGLRAIVIGAAVGAIVLGIRTFLGYERGYMGGRE